MLKVYLCAYPKDITERELSRAVTLLPAYRRDKIAGCRNQEGKLHSLFAGLLLRYACREWGIPGAEESISYGDRGKPYFSPENGFYFNLSHTTGMVMCAMADKEIGCDIERERELSPAMMNHFLAGEEAAVHMAEAEIRKGFFRQWALKESVVKCTGVGLIFARELLRKDVPLLMLCPEGERKYLHPMAYEIDGYGCGCCYKGREEDHPELPLWVEATLLLQG